MASLGTLFLQGGVSGNEQVADSDWIQKSTKDQFTTTDYHFDWAPQMYGYLWYPQGDEPQENLTYNANGMNGQYIYVWEAHNVVLATTSNSYTGADGLVALIEASLTFFNGETYEADEHQEVFGDNNGDDSHSHSSYSYPHSYSYSYGWPDCVSDCSMCVEDGDTECVDDCSTDELALVCGQCAQLGMPCPAFPTAAPTVRMTEVSIASGGALPVLHRMLALFSLVLLGVGAAVVV